VVIFAGFLHLYAKSLSFEFDREIERTFCSIRKNLNLEEQRAKAQQASATMAGGGGDQRRTLQDFIYLVVQGIASSIARPNVEPNSFEIKPTLISTVQQSQFGRTPLEDPNLYLSVLLEV